MNDDAAIEPIWQGLTLRDLITATMVAKPASVIMTDIGLDGVTRDYTGRTIEHLSTRIARRLATAGARPGDAVLIALPNGVPALLALLGTLGAGLTPCMIAPTLHEEALALLMRRLKPRALISAAYTNFDPLTRCVDVARRLAMPLYLWNIGPGDHQHAAPLSDLLDGQAPPRLLPLQPPYQGQGTIMTMADCGRGPEPVLHRQEHLIAQAMLAGMTDQPPTRNRLVSALALNSQAGLVLGLLRALIADKPLTFIADPHAEALKRAAQAGQAEWILPATLALPLRGKGFERVHGPITALYRATHTLHIPTDPRGFVALGEALVLPTMMRGRPLHRGALTLRQGTFATLDSDADGHLHIMSDYSSNRSDGEPAIGQVEAIFGDDGRLARLLPLTRDNYNDRSFAH